jgi:hypothetical protein
MSIRVIDPNEVNNNRRNGTPDYSKMFIFVELLATRRESTILNKRGTILDGSVEKTYDSLTVSMLGYNPDTQRFTSRWSGGSGAAGDAAEPQYEGFGITAIRIVTNSSYIPQVEIEFTDTRGLALFNLGKDSPYSVLHSFPPPLFQLTVKGLYGGQLTYDLHLVKQNTKFEGITGNYVITASFVGRTYAPLTDVLFKYAEIAPYLLQSSGSTSGSNDVTTPTNTLRDFIIKSKKLYEELGDLSQKSEDVTNRQKLINKSEGLISVYNDVNNFPNSFLNTTAGNADTGLINQGYVFIENKPIAQSASQTSEQIATMPANSDPVPYENVTNNIARYDEVIRASAKSKGTDSVPVLDRNKTVRLLLSFKVGNGTNISLINYVKDKLKFVKTTLISKANQYSNATIGSEDISENFKMFAIENEQYIGMDVSDFVQKISVQQRSYIKQVDALNEKLKNKVDTLVESQLQQFKQKVSETGTDGESGFIPTIGNIFRIICNDVDKFFEVLKSTSKEAESHHEANKVKIFDALSHTLKNSDVKKIYPFPVYTEEIVENNGKKRNKAYPGRLPINPEFPEVRLVENFVNAFITLKQQERIIDLRQQEDESGNKKWIPLSPIDSILGNEVSTNSPYFGLKDDPGIDQFFQIFHDRFIGYSQYFYASSFYGQKTFFGLFNRTNKVGINYDTIRQLILEAEVLNITNSLDNPKTTNAIKELAKRFAADPNLFYQELNRRGITLSNPQNLNINGVSIYKDNDLNVPDNESIKIVDGSLLTERISVGDTADPINVFLDSNKSYFEIFDKRNKPRKFTSDNVIYYDDADRGEDFKTNYLVPIALSEVDNITSPLLERYRVMYTVVDAPIRSILTDADYDKYAKAFFIASNYSQNSIAQNVFWGLPAAMKLPQFVLIYLGAYVFHYGNANSGAQAQAEALFSEFNTLCRNHKSGDIEDAINGSPELRYLFIGDKPSLTEHDFIVNELIPNLTESDKTLFMTQFLNFVNGVNDVQSDYERLHSSLLVILNENINKAALDENSDSSYAKVINSEKYRAYDLAFNNASFRETQFEQTLMLPKGLIVYGENAFSNSSAPTFSTIDTINQTPASKQINDNFFTTFFRKLENNLTKVETERVENEAKSQSRLNDDDIKNQCYYSFKSIYDKWLAGGMFADNGYVLANKRFGGNLFDSFIFVDRAFNDISQKCIIDFRPLIEAADDYDVSVFTMMSRLLAHNNFEFFPLQNFMAFKDNEWEKVFETADSLQPTQRPLFVCMYVGGTSTQLNDPNSDYKDDGFNIDDTSSLPVDFLNNNTDVNQVRAFRVRFGAQNNSFWKDVILDTVEHKDTNESLVVLSKIAGDQSESVPVGKAQNLFNVYERRSYTCTVKMLGDAMIQPTQYFQLEGIPMFSGAYMILEVTHDIRPNTMETAFKGVRMLAYPAPIVTDIAVVSGLLGAQSRITQDITGSPTRVNSPNSNRIGNGTTGADYVPNPSAIDPISPDAQLKISP